MDRFKITGQELRDHYASPKTLAAVFGDIERDLQAEKKVVCKFIVNEHDLDESEELDYAGMDLSQVETLEFWTDHVGILVLDVVEGWTQAIPELIQHCDQLSQKIRFEGYYSKLTLVTELFQNANYLIQSLSSLRQILGNSQVHFNLNEEQAQQKVRALMKETMQAIEKKDSVLLADILEFDLAQVLTEWGEFLDHLKKSWEGSQSLANSSYGQAHEISSLIQRSQKIS